VVELASSTAVWYHSGKPAVPIRWVLIRDPEGKFESRALLCTDLSAPAVQIVEWFVRRWRVEVTFEEVRAHLGVEPQRQWSDLPTVRTTPALPREFSLGTSAGRKRTASCSPGGVVHQAAADLFGRVGGGATSVVASARFHTSPSSTDMVKIPRSLLNRFIDMLCYTA
jgi:hypothetical protein